MHTRNDLEMCLTHNLLEEWPRKIENSWRHARGGKPVQRHDLPTRKACLRGNGEEFRAASV